MPTLQEFIYRAGQEPEVIEHEVVASAKTWDAYDFKLRFTPDERVAVRAAGATNGYVADFIDMLDTAAATGTRVHADDALVALGFYVLETMEVISADRAEAILGAAT